MNRPEDHFQLTHSVRDLKSTSHLIRGAIDERSQFSGNCYVDRNVSLKAPKRVLGQAID